MNTQPPIYYSYHAHDKMEELLVSEPEVAETLATGDVSPAKLGRLMAAKVFTEGYKWRGSDYPHREISIVYVVEPRGVTVITLIVRYGFWEANSES